jgi:hypothetical protein
MILSAGIIYIVHIGGASKLPYRISILTDCKLELPQKEMDACHIRGCCVAKRNETSWWKTVQSSNLGSALHEGSDGWACNGMGSLIVWMWLYRPLNLDIWHILWANQGVIKRCRLSWLTNSALVYMYEPKCGGMGGGVVSAYEYTAAYITWHGAQINWRSTFTLTFGANVYHCCVVTAPKLRRVAAS